MNLTSSLLSGIQQVGIGCRDADASFLWYRKAFGMNVPVFKDASTATLMTRYTGNEPRKRYAILALNMQGGGGFEIWQFTDRTPQDATFTIQPGDLGFFGIIMKCRNVKVAHAFFTKKGLNPSEIYPDPAEGERFYVLDPDGNRFTFNQGRSWFRSGNHTNGGVQGFQVGASNIDKSIEFYRSVLGFNKLVSDTHSRFAEYDGLECRRVVLQTTNPRNGAFSRLLGDTEVELIQRADGAGRKIFADRFWGDMGFIHVCFDANNMQALKKLCNENNAAFTVDSADSFDMGAAAGHFSYIEDPDGALIEFVQTHKLPIMKKLNWYLDLRKRNSKRPLPDWLLGAMRFSKVNN